MRLPLLFAAALAASTFSPTSASANFGHTDQEVTDSAVQLRPTLTLLHGRAGSNLNAFGLGLEYAHFPTRSAFHIGAFGDVWREVGEAWRVAAGLRGGWGGYALQLGVSQRTEANDVAAQTALVLGKTYTWGPVGIGYRMTIPLRHYQPAQGAALGERGVEHAFLFSLGWTFNAVGHRPTWGSCGHHRGGTDAEPAID